MPVCRRGSEQADIDPSKLVRSEFNSLTGHLRTGFIYESCQIVRQGSLPIGEGSFNTATLLQPGSETRHFAYLAGEHSVREESLLA